MDQSEQPVPKVEEDWEEERRRMLPSHVQAPARPVAQHQNSGEKEKTRVLALLRHIYLPYSVASDEKLLETSHGLGTGVVPRGWAATNIYLGVAREYMCVGVVF